jgi:hypothetical protein
LPEGNDPSPERAQQVAIQADVAPFQGLRTYKYHRPQGVALGYFVLALWADKPRPHENFMSN